ncbi:MAG TPA: hypothetical protein VEB22_01995 [Phycisphaerales bacterium]|nr:hypothetical protein [Phycisphaerales bacterium]
MIYIEDDIHCELDGPYPTVDEAVAELRRRATIAWDAPPNQAPCTSWKTCGREYYVVEYRGEGDSAEVLRRLHVLGISAKGVVWAEGYGPI